MKNVEILPSQMKNLDEINLFIEENDISEAEYEFGKNLFSDLKKMALGTTCFLMLYTPPSLIPHRGNFDQEKNSYEQMLYEYEEHIGFFQEIEDDLNRITTQTSVFDEFIDGDEIKQEIEIISDYMSNVNKFYAFRKRNILI